jgi:hypothetical protein
MTDEQLKTLAELVLITDERLTVLESRLNNWIEISLSLFPKDSAAAQSAGLLISGFEQSEALERDAKAAREQTREFFGLD